MTTAQPFGANPWSSPAIELRITAFVAGLDLDSRVRWLRAEGVSPDTVFQALLDANDPDLTRFTEAKARMIASQCITRQRKQVPPWLQ